MRRPALLAVAVLVASCAEPAPPAGPPPAPPAPPDRAEPSPEPPPSPEPGTVTAMELDTFFGLQQSGRLLIYDVRPRFVHAFGAIPGAVNWPESAYDAQLATREDEIRAAVAAGRSVALYCTDASCPDSRKVASRLAGRGHDVSILEGGYALWKEAGLPTE